MNVDWHSVFVPNVPILETIVRGTVMYLVLFVILRLTFKRIGSGSIGLGDVLMIALVAAAAQNAMARNHISVTDGIILVATIVRHTFSTLSAILSSTAAAVGEKRPFPPPQHAQRTDHRR